MKAVYSNGDFHKLKSLAAKAYEGLTKCITGVQTELSEYNKSCTDTFWKRLNYDGRWDSRAMSLQFKISGMLDKRDIVSSLEKKVDFALTTGADSVILENKELALLERYTH